MYPSKAQLWHTTESGGSAYVPAKGAVAEASPEEDLAEAMQLAIAAKRRDTRIKQLYVIHAEETWLHKIGVAVCAQKRLQTLQKGFPYRLRLVYVAEYDDGLVFYRERQAHRQMADCRLLGEWFEFDPEEFLAAIKTVRARRAAAHQEQTHEDGGK